MNPIYYSGPLINQFGGAKGCGTSHLLIEVWQNILQDLEDNRAATLLTAIDYAKAFNRMQFQECLKSFARHGPSSEVIGLVATFLTDRRMSVRVGSSWSKERRVDGGVPQGSILGVLLFNLTTDNLEDEDSLAVRGPTARANSSTSSSDNSSGSEQDICTTQFSTPSAACPDFEPGFTPFRKGHSSFVFLSNARNLRRALLSEDNDITLLRDTTIPSEPVTSAIWKPRAAENNKYVDDGIIDSKLDMENVITTMISGRPTRSKHAIASQNMFRRIVRNAELIGMKVNASKTNQICISDSLSYDADAFLYTTTGEKSGCSEELKLLGFYFGRRPTCARHVQAMKRSFRGKFWLLIHLKQHGFTESELLRVYCTIICPVAEYCAPVFHSMLTDQQDKQIERLQSTALRYVFGYGLSYARMREMVGLDTLRNRRVALCDKFANKCINSDRFSGWFPEVNSARRSRHTLKFKEIYARCDRLKNSPLFYMRRRMNGKEGKKYGKRNCQYRDN